MKVPSKGPRVVLPRGVDVKYPVNVSVYVPSAAVWSIPFRRVLWFIFLNKLTLAKKTQTCERPTILALFLWYVETDECAATVNTTLSRPAVGPSCLPPLWRVSVRFFSRAVSHSLSLPRMPCAAARALSLTV